MQDPSYTPEGPQVVTGTSWSRFEVGAEEVVWAGFAQGTRGVSDSHAPLS